MHRLNGGVHLELFQNTAATCGVLMGILYTTPVTADIIIYNNTHFIHVCRRWLDASLLQDITKIETVLEYLQRGAEVFVLCLHIAACAMLQPLVTPVDKINNNLASDSDC